MFSSLYLCGLFQSETPSGQGRRASTPFNSSAFNNPSISRNSYGRSQRSCVFKIYCNVIRLSHMLYLLLCLAKIITAKLVYDDHIFNSCVCTKSCFNSKEEHWRQPWLKGYVYSLGRNKIFICVSDIVWNLVLTLTEDILHKKYHQWFVSAFLYNWTVEVINEVTFLRLKLVKHLIRP